MSVLSQELFGREAELSRLRDRLREALGGRGGVVIVLGEAGIGKTALADATKREAQQLGMRVIAGRAWEFADAPPYFPVRSGLRALGITPALPAASEADAFGLWEDLLESLARESAQTPLFWLIEDLHAADAQTIELLAFLAQPLHAIGALVLLTLRSGDSRATEPVLQRLTRLTRDSEVIELARLGATDVAALAARTAGRALPVDSIAAWVERTGGNPLFVVECARAVRAGRNVESALPGTIVQVVVERLRALAPTTRGWLEQGAVLGRDFAAAQVARIAQRLPAEVIDALLPALRAGLIEETAPGQFRFVHALVRDAIEEAMPVVERRDVHARVVAALGAQSDTPDVVVLQAHHAIEGLGPLSEPRVHELVARAVASLEIEGAHDRAFALWRRWLDRNGTQPTLDALMDLARLASAAGNHAQAARAAEAASALAKLTGDPVRIALAALALTASATPGAVESAHVRVLEDAAARLPAERDPRIACLLEARLSAALQPAADPSVPVAMARAAIARARSLGDGALLREVLLLGGSALNYFVNTVETHALFGELLSLSLAAGDSARALRAFTRRVVSHLELGDFAAFDTDAERMLGLARAVGHPTLTWRPFLVASMRALARGQFDESERFITEIEQTAAHIDDPALMLMLQAHKAYRTFSIDDERETRNAYVALVPQFARAAGAFGCSIRALFAVRLGERAAAAAEIRALLQYSRTLPSDSPMLGTIGETVALAGTQLEREELYAQLLPLDGREVHTAPIPQTYEGPVARVLGLLEASLGRFDAADARFDTTRERCRTLGLRPWVARITLERANLWLDAGRTREARTLFEEAASLASELRMSGIETRARRALGTVRRAPTQVTGATHTEGTALLSFLSEGEVWCIAWGDHIVRVRDSRGIQLLAKLVASPRERIHALVLTGDGDAFVPESSAGEASDRKAVAAYRARLSKLDDELADAESKSDRARSERYRHERQQLVAEISRAVGLGGRLRKVGSASERARINVTRRLKDAVARIADVDAVIGRHLERSIQTGTYCCYHEKSQENASL